MCLLHLWFPIRQWPLTTRSNVSGLWHCFVFGPRVFVFSHSYTIWMYYHGTMCREHQWTMYDLDLWSQFQIMFSPWIWDLQEYLFSDIGVPNVGIWYITMNQHVHSWPVFVLDFWLIFGWEGGGGWVRLRISLSEFFSQVLSFLIIFIGKSFEMVMLFHKFIIYLENDI